MNKDDKHEDKLSIKCIDGSHLPDSGSSFFKSYPSSDLQLSMLNRASLLTTLTTPREVSNAGSCNWWSANDLMVTSESLSATTKVSYLSPPPPPLAQPRRIVEEVLGHLYAKPPLTEVTCPSSGINGSPSGKLKGASQSFQSKAKIGSLTKLASALGSNERLSNKFSETADSPELSPSCKLPSSSRRKPTENSHAQGHRDNRKIARRSEVSGVGFKQDMQYNSLLQEVQGNEDNHRIEETTSSSTGAGSMSSANSSSDTSESEEDEEQKAAEERRQRKLAELKEKRKELRKKVKQLKHASLESSRQGKDGVSSPSKNSSSSSGKSNSSLVPTPAHSYATSLYSCGSNSLAPVQDGDLAMPAPLDLCVKKPDFVTSTPLQQSPPSKFIDRRRARKVKNSLMDSMMSFKSESNQETSFSIMEQSASLEHSSLLKGQNCLLSHTSDTESVSSNKANQSRSSMDYQRRRKRMKPNKPDSMNLDTKQQQSSPSGSSSETESSLDTGSDSDNTDDSEKSAAVSTASSAQTSAGLKRHSEEAADSSAKRKRVLPEEKEIRIPVEHGWRRQTKIRCFSRCGVRGEVCYFTPCGKKLRNYSEVVRYLQRNSITDINRDNFSFSTKINVGDFLERVGGSGPEEYVLLSENEILARIEEVRARKGSLGVQSRRSTQPKTNEETEKQKRWEELQMQRRLEQQEMARQAQEWKLAKRVEKEQALGVLKENKRLKGGAALSTTVANSLGDKNMPSTKKSEELRKQKEQQRQAKQQEKLDKLEQQRIEKEMRNQQLLEERERRRQHMMLVRALESRKKQEEREKKREEIMNEKKIYKEKRMEQRRIELQLIREMKKPVDDMQLKDTTPLPTLNRIPGLKIAGKVFGDILMVYEFLTNFGETLGFDVENLPSLSTFQLGLLNYDEKHEEELLSVVHHLLVCAIEDPGVPHCPQASNVLNQHLREVDITNNNVSEAIRLYFTAVDRSSDIWRWLNERPYLALNPTQKASIMAYLCNELLYSKTVIRQIENSIDAVNSLKRDKWVVEGQLRRLRAIHQRRCHPSKLASAKEGEELDSKAEKLGVASHQIPKKGRDDEEDVGNDSGNDSDETQETGHPSDAEDEEPDITNEELEKKIEKLNRQQHQFQNKLAKACGAVRTNSFGQDRFRRRYWVIPSIGGMFVEAMESSDLLSEEESLVVDEEDDKSVVAEEEDGQKMENAPSSTKEDQKTQEIMVKSETTEPEVPSDTSMMDVETKSVVKLADVKEESIPSEMEIEPLLILEKEEVKLSMEDDKVGKLLKNEEEPAMKIDSCEKELAMSIPNKVDKKPIAEEIVTLGCEDDSKKLLTEVKTEKESSKQDPTDSVAKVIADNSDKLKVSTTTNPPKIDSGLPKDIFPLSVPTVGKIAPSTGHGDKNWLMHSPFFASILAGSLFFNGPMMHGRELNGTYLDGMPGKTANSASDSPFGPFLNFPPDGTATAEQMMKSLVDGQSRRKPWFSILPRVPCDTKSVVSCGDKKETEKPSTTSLGDKPEKTQSASASSSSTPSNVSMLKAGGSSSEGGNQITAAALANLHIGLLNGIPPDILMHSFLAAHGLSQMYHQQQTTPAPHLAGCSPNSTTYSIGDSTLASSDVELFAMNLAEHPRKQMLDKMQYKKPKVIPPEMRRGWWRITDVGQLKTLLAACHHRGIREKQLQKHIQKHFSYAAAQCGQSHNDALDLEITELDREISKQLGGAPEPDLEDAWLPEVALRVDLAVLDLVENLEEKVAGASMQMKEVPDRPHTSWRLPPRLSNDDSANFKAACEFDPTVNPTNNSVLDDDEENSTEQRNPDEPMNPVEVAKKRLLNVEAAIERRYIRPPLGTSTELNLNTITSSNSCGGYDETTPGLLKWRRAVGKCTSSAQLAMCINALEASIAWDKSIMRASCQFCHNGDNEEMLLLCDGCDKGYHTYCFKPKMETIPDGDWYCYECLNKATGDKVCVLCGKKGKMVSCETCPKTFHITCLDPPLPKIPKGKWYCSACGHKHPPKKSKAKSSNKETAKEMKENGKKSETPKPKEKKEKNKNPGNKDITPCRTIVGELQSHEDAWPFLLPVNTKQFPTYRKIIRKAMDLTTIQSKLDGYKTREDFAADVRLIFDNCETFNEDDSPVGIAGHNMRAFFEVRWAELCGT